jgi:hypothetical protein
MEKNGNFCVKQREMVLKLQIFILNVIIKDQLSSLSHQNNDIILLDILLFHGFLILKLNRFKIYPNSLLFFHSKILTTFNHQNIISLNKNMQFFVFQIVVLSLAVMVVMIFVCNQSDLNKNRYALGFPNSYSDTTRKGNLTFTGNGRFSVRETEVFQVSD